MRFRKVPVEDVDWTALDRYADRTYSQRLPWLNYLRSIGAGSPVIAVLEDDHGRELGCFTGMTNRRFGFSTIGAPLPGWNTAYLGLNLAPGVPRADALRALTRFAFRQEKCLYLEMSDPAADAATALGAGFQIAASENYVSDLTQPEETLFNLMNSATRRCIRKAEREGVTVEVAAPEGFAADYHSQLCEVFARQGLIPTYPRERVEKLIEHVHPSGMLLLLRARAPDGRSIGTAIYPGFGQHSIFWGNGSVTEMHHLRPNQALHWYAMRHWKARGVTRYDWGGTAPYKKNYGPQTVTCIRQFKSALPVLDKMRAPALRSYKAIRKWRSRQLAEQEA